MTRAITLAEIADGAVLSVDTNNSRVGIGSTIPRSKLDLGTGNAHTHNINSTGVITATKFIGDGSELSGVAADGLGEALSSDTSSPLARIFKTTKQLSVGAGTSIKVQSDTASGDIAYMRENVVHVAVGATFHIGTGTTLISNVLNLF